MGQIVTGRKLTATGRTVQLMSRRTYETGRPIPAGHPFNYLAQYTPAYYHVPRLGTAFGSTLKAQGTSPPAWTLGGTGNAIYGPHFEIDSVAGGTALGQATYKWSMDNGTTYVATGVTTAAGPTVLGTTGFTVAMAAGPYNIDNKWDATVAQMDDQFTTGVNVLQGTASRQPVFNITALNGVPGLVFDGVDDILDSGVFTAVAQPTIKLFLAKITSATAQQMIVDGGAERNVIYRPNATNAGIYAGGSLITGAYAHNNAWHVWTANFDGANSFLRIDGVQIAAGNPGAQGFTKLRYGADSVGSNPFGGVLGESFCFAGRVAVTDIVAMEGYLKRLAGI